MKNNHAPDLSAQRGSKTGPDGFHANPSHAPAGLRPRTRWSASLPCIILALLFVLHAFAAEPEVRLTFQGRAANGVATLQLSGTIPGAYRIEASQDLRNWQPLTTNTLLNTPVIIVDATGAGTARRFYRAVRLNTVSYQPGIVLLRFRAAASDAGVASVFDAVPLTLGEEIWTSAMQAAGQDPILCMHTTLPVEEAVRQLTNNPAIEFAEPNYLLTHTAASNDPKFTDGSLWGMYGDASSPANGFGSQVAEAWAEGYTGSRQVYVGIIDEGLQYEHPELAANVWMNPFDPPNGTDDDGNGYVDDARGWDFYYNDNSVFDGSVNGPGIDAHGTHVAGTIGGLGGNGQGVAGVNWQVTMISGKFLGPGGGYIGDAIKAVDYFTDLKQRHGLNLVALNNSWGGGGYSQGLHEAIIRAAKANILFIAAAGNAANDNDARAAYPASYDTTQGTSREGAADYDAVIAVAAIALDGSKAWFSSYGVRTVDLGAPGVGVWSSVPWLSYASYGGTSMATPHVTGAAALYASTHPGAGAAQIRAALLGSTIPTPSLAGKCVTGGRLNLSTVIRPPVTPPPPTPVVNAPVNLRATAVTNTSLSLAWDDRADNEDGFHVDRSTNGTAFSHIATLGRNANSLTDGAVGGGRRYWYRVRAFNGQTNSAWSNVLPVTTPATPPPQAPVAPSNLRATVAGTNQVQLAWQDNSANETGFRIERATGSGGFSLLANVGAGVTSYTDATVTPGRTYSYRACAFNAAGSSTWAATATVSVPPVTSLEKYVDAAYTGSIEDGSAARPFKTLRSAMAAAAGAGAVLRVRPGQYHEGSLAPGKVMLLQPEGGTVRISP